MCDGESGQAEYNQTEIAESDGTNCVHENPSFMNDALVSLS